MDVTLQGNAMSPAKPKRDKTVFDKIADAADSAGGRLLNKGLNQGIAVGFLIWFTQYYLPGADTQRRQDFAEMESRHREENKDLMLTVVGKVQEMGKQFDESVDRLASQNKEAVIELSHGQDNRFKILVEALSRNTQKLDETAKSVSGAAQAIQAAANGVQ